MIKNLSILLLMTALSPATFAKKEVSYKLHPFSTDGCSSLAPDGTFSDSDKWQLCCIEHDVQYWMGGTAQERLEADRELRLCIASTGHPYIAKAYYQGVRIGGVPMTTHTYRWAYGWEPKRAYQELSELEFEKVLELIPEEAEKLTITDPTPEEVRRAEE